MEVWAPAGRGCLCSTRAELVALRTALAAVRKLNGPMAEPHWLYVSTHRQSYSSSTPDQCSRSDHRNRIGALAAAHGSDEAWTAHPHAICVHSLRAGGQLVN